MEPIRRVALILASLWDRYPEATYQVIRELTAAQRAFEKGIEQGKSVEEALAAGMAGHAKGR